MRVREATKVYLASWAVAGAVVLSLFIIDILNAVGWVS